MDTTDSINKLQPELAYTCATFYIMITYTYIFLLTLHYYLREMEGWAAWYILD
jgi:hypothetical protein